MTRENDVIEFTKLHTKVTGLLWLLSVGTSLLLSVLGFGAVKLIDISRDLGSVMLMRGDLNTLELRIDKHISEETLNKYMDVKNNIYTKSDIFQTCHLVN